MRKVIILFLLLFLVDLSVSGLYAKIYKGAEYRTIESFLYGRFEVRYKPANREGVVSSFFTYHDGGSGWNEIDFEFIGRYSNSIQFNTITPGQRFHIRTQHINFDPYVDFHDYAFEWTPEYVAWFIDGVEVYRQTGEHISTLQYPQKIMMNIWNPIYTNWVGYFDDILLPTVSVYDNVKYSSYTPGSGNYGTNNDFTFEWEDDFDSFDTDRWTKATHSFSGNQADFITENAIFEDGLLHLYLTRDNAIGGIDNNSPKILWARANYDSTITFKLNEEITKESGENIANFTLPGATLSSAELDLSSLIVKLTATGYNPYNLNNLIYSNLTDLSANANTSTTQVILVNKVDSINFPLKVNVGGVEYNDYLADQEWSSAVQYGFWMGDINTYPGSLDIIGTEEDEIFRSERKGLVTYKFKLPKGLYKVIFMFSENINNSVGEGIFNIHAENKLIHNNIDLINLVGKNTAHNLESEVEVNDGVLDIYFEESIDSAFVNGIMVDRILTDVKHLEQTNLINQLQLYQNYPNPFNPKTLISYRVVERSTVSLEIFDVIGNKIETLINETKNPGKYNVNFDASKRPSGIYFYRLIANGHNIATKKMIVLK